MLEETRHVETNGITLRVIDAGPAGAPVVLLLHGFPETSHSWRHQIPALADAGFHVLAPDLPGYGGSDAPPGVEPYGIANVAPALLGLLDDAGADDAVVVGHDWGALLTWDLCQLHPSRVRAACALSVPFFKMPVPPTELFEQLSGGGFFYILYFQDIGPAEAELERDVRTTMRRVLFGASADGAAGARTGLPREGTGFLDMMPDAPDELPEWLTEADLDTYVDAFERSGFNGPLGYYRSFDANWRLTHEVDLAVMTMPTYFIAGDKDGVVAGGQAMVDAAHSVLPNHKGSLLIPGAGHWVQQEAPAATTQALLDFLTSL
jgi:pimeloyl-ACP methyl ester carboxylesterase